MNERGRNEADISRYTDVEYSPEGYKTVYRWGDFLEIAGGHVYNAMDTIDLVSAGGEYEGFNPRYAYTCEFVGCSTLIDGIALFRPVSRDGEDLTQIAFLRSDIDDDTGAYTERFEAGSFDIAAASDIQCSDLGIDLLDYFRGRSFEGLSGVKRGLNGREAVGAVEVATGCDLDLFEDFWLGSPGETDVHVGPYVKRDLIALSYIVNDFSQMYGTQRGTCTQGLHFYYADEPKPAPEFFIPPNRPPRPVVCLDTGETFESSFQAGRAFGITPGGVRTSASTGVERGGLHFYFGDEPKPAPEFFRERHSKTRPIVCLETGESFMGNPAAARPLHVSPAAISQAVRYGSPVNGLHFYHGDEPKPAPEFFKPAKGKGGKSPAAIAAAAKAAAGNSAPGTDYREHGIQRDRRAVQ